MELQEKKFSCGPSALRAALYMMGRTVTEAALRKWAGTTPDGTDERGMLRALSHYGVRGKEHQLESAKESWKWLRRKLSRGRPVILCVDSWQHWLTVVGTIGGKVLVFDPDSTGNRRKKYSGLRLYTETELAARWAYSDEETKRNVYYGIVVG